MNPLRGCSPRASCRHSTAKTIKVSRTTWPGRRSGGNEPLDPHPEPGSSLVARQLGQGGAQRRGPSTREQLVRCDRVIQDHPEGHQQNPPGQPGTGPPGRVHLGWPPHSPGYVRHQAVLCALACAQGSRPSARQTRAERRGTTIADSRIVSRAAGTGRQRSTVPAFSKSRDTIPTARHGKALRQVGDPGAARLYSVSVHCAPGEHNGRQRPDTCPAWAIIRGSQPGQDAAVTMCCALATTRSAGPPAPGGWPACRVRTPARSAAQC